MHILRIWMKSQQHGKALHSSAPYHDIHNRIMIIPRHYGTSSLLTCCKTFCVMRRATTFQGVYMGSLSPLHSGTWISMGSMGTHAWDVPLQSLSLIWYAGDDDIVMQRYYWCVTTSMASPFGVPDVRDSKCRTEIAALRNKEGRSVNSFCHASMHVIATNESSLDKCHCIRVDCVHLQFQDYT